MEKKKVENREEGVYYREEFENNCCDKCHDVTFEKTYPAHTAYHACMDLKCKCHSLQKESEWEKKFENYCEVEDESGKVFSMFNNAEKRYIKSFVRETLSNREKEIAEEVAVTFARSPLNKRRDKDADAFYLDVLQIIKH